LTYVELR